MRRLHPAPACGNWTCLESIHAEKVQPDCRAHDVDDRIDCAHFVKMNLGELGPMHLGLGLSQLEKDPLGQVLLARSQAALIDDCLDMMPVAMSMLFRGDHLGIGGAKAAPADRLERELAG